jgi:hypothetical protein
VEADDDSSAMRRMELEDHVPNDNSSAMMMELEDYAKEDSSATRMESLEASSHDQETQEMLAPPPIQEEEAPSFVMEVVSPKRLLIPIV